jgi:two-component system, NtrC family, response regulator AtoC
VIDPLDDETVATLDPTDTGKHRLYSELSLVVVSPSFTATYALPQSGEVTIGRSKSIEIYVDDKSVSRTHAQIKIESQQLWIRDLGSSNGTRVSGNRLEPEKPHKLRIGDAISVGSVTLLLQSAVTSVRPRRFWRADDFEVRLEEECARAQRSAIRFTVAYLRVDRTAVDIAVRQLLARQLRSSDVVGEYSASEYAVVLTDSSADKARGVIGRIADELLSMQVAPQWGIVEFPNDGTSAHQLVSAAQLAMHNERAAVAAGKEPVLVDRKMLEVIAFVKLIAAGDLGVLLLGETGVGKEVIAEEVHRLSRRSDGPFVRLNCAALSEQLLESELFGYERGAFTGADKSKPGLIETAAGGTVFFDEIGELPMNLQAKLLRVIEEKQALRVGGIKPRPLDVRFVAATNRDLEQQAKTGRFREDLYYRLAGATVAIPPLRERPADIEPLARMFLRNAASHLGRSSLDIRPDARALLLAYQWPGNVRELRNVIERAALVCGSEQIGVPHLPSSIRHGGKPDLSPPPETQPFSVVTHTSIPVQRPLRHGAPTEPPPTDPEHQRIVDVLNACGGNQSRAAKELGLSRAALIRRLEKIGGVVRPRK